MGAMKAYYQELLERGELPEGPEFDGPVEPTVQCRDCELEFTPAQKHWRLCPECSKRKFYRRRA